MQLVVAAVTVTTVDTGESHETNKRKICCSSSQKEAASKIKQANKQALSEVANSLKVMAETSLKRFRMMAEEDKRREERYIAFLREEAEKIWEHELLIPEIFARAAQPTSPPNFVFSHFPIGHTSTPRG